MKRPLLSLLFLFMFSAVNVHAQSQRLVLLEEFTQASCGPCASANPGILSIMNTNPTKITGIFYHVSWPGTDPMYLHNKVDPTARVAYYNFNYVPYSAIDGNYFRGAPSDWNVNTVNTRYTVPSPFVITMNTHLSSTNDTVFVTMLVNATADISGIMAAHMVVVEKHIHYATAPGTNGEKDFYNVVKKMLPTASGTALPLSMKTGDYVILEGAWPLANVFTTSEISAVGFVQSSSKEILQAANASLSPVTGLYANDAQLLSVGNVLSKYCREQLAPTVAIRNNGSLPLTSLNIKYLVNAGDTASYHWTGNLGFLETATIELPTKEYVLGDQNTLRIFTDNPNNLTDDYGKNDTIVKSFQRAPVASVSVVAKIKTDNNPQEITWDLKNSLDQVLYSGGPYTNPLTTYQQAFALEQGECYSFSIYDAGNNGICCTNGNGYYILVNGTTNFITGTQFTDRQSVQFSTTVNTGINQPQVQTVLSVYPNPFVKVATISFDLGSAAKARIQVLNLMGQTVFEIPESLYHSGNNEVLLDGERLQPGIYQVVVKTGSRSISTRISFTR